MLSSVHESVRHIGGSYPPWSYTTGLLLVPPVEWTVTRWYFAVLSLLSLGLSAFCAYRWCRPSGSMPSAIAAAMVFALFPSAIWPVVEIADTLIWVAAGWHIPFDRTAQRWTGEPWPVTRPATAR
jgi:hypothetical protein